MMMRAHSLTVRHNFETAHRLPHLGGKCRNLHGHSWWAEVTVSAPNLTDAGTIVEFGAYKKALRGWIDEQLDHGAMLGVEDPLLPALLADGTKVFQFGTPQGEEPKQSWTAWDLQWPTVENVARLLARVAQHQLLTQPRAQGAHVSRVLVSETHVNTAGWVA